MTPYDQTLQDLIMARAYVAEPRMWCQGRFCLYETAFLNPWMRFCAMGAILRAVEGDANADPNEQTCLVEAEVLRAIHALNQNGKIHFMSVIHWNDYYSRSHKQVLEVFDYAIAHRRAYLSTLNLRRTLHASLESDARVQGGQAPFGEQDWPQSEIATTGHRHHVEREEEGGQANSEAQEAEVIL